MKLLLFIPVFFAATIYSQENLVFNGDFEEFSDCPAGFSDPTQFPKEIEKCLGWKAPTFGTSDYFNECSTNSNTLIPNNGMGQQPAFSGSGYLGALVANYTGGAGIDGYNGVMWWEYIQGKLKVPLENGKTYKVSLHVSVGEYSDLAIKEIGVLFSSNSISSLNTSSLDLIPQCSFKSDNYFIDTSNWVKLETFFIAQGGENYITIGNFKNNVETDTMRRFDISPQGQNPMFSYMYFDKVELTDAEYLFESPNVFTPNNDHVNDLWQSPVSLYNKEIIILNRWGNTIFVLNKDNSYWDGKDLNGNLVSSGVYFYIIYDLTTHCTIYQNYIHVIN